MQNHYFKCTIQLLILLVTVLVLSVNSSLAEMEMVTINFEVLSANEFIPEDTFRDQGVKMFGGRIFRVGVSGWDLAHSGIQGLTGTTSVSSIDGAHVNDIMIEHGVSSSRGGGVIDILFVDPESTEDNPISINEFSMWMGFDPSGEVPEAGNFIIIEAFDQDDNRLIDFTSASLIGISDQFQSFQAPGIVRLRITDAGFAGIDDLSFTIPEPSSVFILGILASGMISRRRLTA